MASNFEALLDGQVARLCLFHTSTGGWKAGCPRNTQESNNFHHRHCAFCPYCVLIAYWARIARNPVAAIRWPVIPAPWAHWFSGVFPWPMYVLSKTIPWASGGLASIWSQANLVLKPVMAAARGQGPPSQRAAALLASISMGFSREDLELHLWCQIPTSGFKVLLEALPQPSPGDPLSLGARGGLGDGKEGWQVGGALLFSHYL